MMPYWGGGDVTMSPGGVMGGPYRNIPLGGGDEVEFVRAGRLLASRVDCEAVHHYFTYTALGSQPSKTKVYVGPIHAVSPVDIAAPSTTGLQYEILAIHMKNMDAVVTQTVTLWGTNSTDSNEIFTVTLPIGGIVNKYFSPPLQVGDGRYTTLTLSADKSFKIELFGVISPVN